MSLALHLARWMAPPGLYFLPPKKFCIQIVSLKVHWYAKSIGFFAHFPDIDFERISNNLLSTTLKVKNSLKNDLLKRLSNFPWSLLFLKRFFAETPCSLVLTKLQAQKKILQSTKINRPHNLCTWDVLIFYEELLFFCKKRTLPNVCDLKRNINWTHNPFWSQFETSILKTQDIWISKNLCVKSQRFETFINLIATSIFVHPINHLLSMIEK